MTALLASLRDGRTAWPGPAARGRAWRARLHPPPVVVVVGGAGGLGPAARIVSSPVRVLVP
jgi:hypothetical protein